METVSGGLPTWPANYAGAVGEVPKCAPFLGVGATMNLQSGTRQLSRRSLEAAPKLHPGQYVTVTY